MKRRISLDCDGVIADVESFFIEYYKDYFGNSVPQDFIQACYNGKLEKYVQKENIDFNIIKDFFKEYEADLFLSLPKLQIISGAKEGIKEITRKGIEIIVNSYRPSKYMDITQDTEKITEDWFERNGIYVPIHLAENKEEKCNNIKDEIYYCHVDDDPIILKQLPISRIKPILLNSHYKQSEEKYLQFHSWSGLTKFLTGEKNV